MEESLLRILEGVVLLSSHIRVDGFWVRVLVSNGGAE